MKKYTYYIEYGEDGGGEGACFKNMFVPFKKYCQDDGSLLLAREAVTDFNNVTELAAFFRMNNYDDLFYNYAYACDLVNMANNTD
jgi:hypothetical protein